ncbi:MAG: hypothetical protein K5650_08240 [Bacteroidales bacterium]|nr:hypothetical protein [Bacteroidales bacterium]
MKKAVLFLIATVLAVVVIAQPDGAIMKSLAVVPGPYKVVKAIDDSNAVALATGSSGSPHSLVVIPLGTMVDHTLSSVSCNSAKIDCPDSVYLMDVCVLERYVFVCGSVRTTSGTKAMIGYAALSFLHDRFVSPLYVYALDCAAMAEKITAYTVPGSTAKQLAVVGVDYPDGTFWGTYSLINVDFYATPSVCNSVKLPTNYRITGLTQTVDCVVVTGEFYDQDGFHFVAKCDKGSGSFTLDIHPMASADYIIGNGVSCTSTIGDDIAIAYYTQKNVSPRVLIRIIKLYPTTITNTHSYMVPVNGKIEAPTMAYMPDSMSLVLLFSGNALPSFNGPAFVSFRPYLPTLVKLFSPITNTDYYNVSLFGRKHFIAASDNDWFICNESSSLPNCTVMASAPVYNIENVGFLQFKINSTLCTTTYFSSYTYNNYTISHICIH